MTGEGKNLLPLAPFPSFYFTMDLASVIVECHARERALMAELEAAKIARVEAEGAKREALAEKEAANREKEAGGCDP